MSDAEELARACWIADMVSTGSEQGWAEAAWDYMGGSEPTMERTEYLISADMVLRSGALARRDARIKTDALREAADRIEAVAANAWGGPASWMTTGTGVGRLVSAVLRAWADEAGEGA